MASTEYAKRFEGKSSDTFQVTRETEMDMLECIYTARIEAWTVDDWTRVRTAHSNHHLMMTVTWCLMSLSTKKKKQHLGHIEMTQSGVWSGYLLFAIFL